MKWYAFLDDGGNTVNLLLDHNTTALIAWNSSGSNASGPNELLTALWNDTDSWTGVPTRSDSYIANHGGANFTIGYATHKARLITAQEVANIKGEAAFDEKISTSSISSLPTWLYTNLPGPPYGYWTSSPIPNVFGYYYAWGVNSNGYLSPYFVNGDGGGGSNNGIGARPVITVLKSST